VANLLYLIGAIAAIAVICTVLYVRTRKPRTLEYGIDSFQRELRALSPERPDRTDRADRPGADRPGAEKDGRRSG
jgi:hypothetical protein